jgi:peptidoglycan biosynthesis protein MviN/MurJ (putative lipid II flippase)
MISVTCLHCGLPLRVARVTPDKPVYCCSGCALAARVPVDANGQYPVNGTLVTALGVGFVAFNQLLFWLLAVLLAREGQSQTAARLLLGSLAAGGLVWLALAWFQVAVGARQIWDIMFLALGACLIALGVIAREPCVALAGNLGLIAWSVRGLRRRKVV